MWRGLNGVCLGGCVCREREREKEEGLCRNRGVYVCSESRTGQGCVCVE
jgi:hypothetical protein